MPVAKNCKPRMRPSVTEDTTDLSADSMMIGMQAARLPVRARAADHALSKGRTRRGGCQVIGSPVWGSSISPRSNSQAAR